MEVYDSSPETLRFAIPVVIAPGWGGTPKAYEGLVAELVALGRRVLFLFTPHGIDMKKDVEQLPDAELRKAAALIEALERKSIDKIDIIAHSEAGIWVALAARQMPEKFRSIVLLNPAGMMGKDSLKRLAFGFTKDTLDHIIRGIRDRSLREPVFRSLRLGLDTLRADPVSAVRQVLAIANTDTRDTLQDLRRNGVRIGLLQTVHDRTFPPEKVLANISFHDFDNISWFPDRKAIHTEPVLQPSAFAKMIHRVLLQFDGEENARESALLPAS